MSRHLLTSRTLFTTLPALDEEKERPMIFLLRARKPANLPPGDGRAGIL